MSNTLTDLLPDLVLVLRRDGSIVSQMGGQAVPHLRGSGGRWEEACSPETATLIKQLVRRSLMQRAPLETRFQDDGRHYEVRVTPQGPDRAVGIVRAMLADGRAEGLTSSEEGPRPQLDRRGFLRRLKESMSLAALREQPLAVAVLYIDGIPDIAQIITARISEQVMSAALLRIPSQDADEQPRWYLGQLGENLLAMVMETSDRDVIDACVTRVAASLRQPINVDEVEFRLRPYAGVGVLGLDAASPKILLEHARAAANEARRIGSNDVHFHSDTMKLRSLERLDLARELREAIAGGDIRFRYVGRHDLETGRLVAYVGYVRWQHPLRGDIRPAEFLRVAETTGLAVALSRAALKSLCEDFSILKNRCDDDVRISFGALRDHFFHEGFLSEMERMLSDEVLPAERLELRIAEKTFVAHDPNDFRRLHRRAVQIVVDEVGRGMISLSSLARAPLWGLQLDRAWVTSVRNDAAARKVCSAGINMASAFGLTTIAAGIDDEAQRQTLLELGCRYGSGDLYPLSDQT